MTINKELELTSNETKAVIEAALVKVAEAHLGVMTENEEAVVDYRAYGTTTIRIQPTTDKEIK